MGTLFVVGAWRVFLILAVILLLLGGTRRFGKWPFFFAGFLALMALSGVMVKTMSLLLIRLLPIILVLYVVVRMLRPRK